LISFQDLRMPPSVDRWRHQRCNVMHFSWLPFGEKVKILILMLIPHHREAFKLWLIGQTLCNETNEANQSIGAW